MSYSSDLNDNQWQLIKHFFKPGNKSFHNKKDLVNAVFYVAKTGCQWRLIPKVYPKWQTVYSFYSRAMKAGIWEKVMAELVRKNRNRHGKLDTPTYCIIDSQSIKTIGKAMEKGFDGGKKN